MKSAVKLGILFQNEQTKQTPNGGKKLVHIQLLPQEDFLLSLLLFRPMVVLCYDHSEWKMFGSLAALLLVTFL